MLLLIRKQSVCLQLKVQILVCSSTITLLATLGALSLVISSANAKLDKVILTFQMLVCSITIYQMVIRQRIVHCC